MHHSVGSDARVRLLEIEPDIVRFLDDDERAEVRGVTLPVADVPKGEQRIQVAHIDERAFGALVLEGMLLQRLRVGEQEAVRLIGPGDIIAVEEPRGPTTVSQSSCSALADTRLAIFGESFLGAARRWPALVAGLHVCASGHLERISAQLVICQLPRVADRLLAMMWLLAEAWGRVTPVGVTLPLSITHETFGALIGARRPTVSLALTELVERGAVVRQDGGWLLLEALPEVPPTVPPVEAPVLLARDETAWTEAPPRPTEPLGAELLETVGRLRQELGHSREMVYNTLAEVRKERDRIKLRRGHRPVSR